MRVGRTQSATGSSRRLRPVQALLVAGSASAVVVAVAMLFVLTGLTGERGGATVWGAAAAGLGVFVIALCRIAVRSDEDSIVVTNTWRTYTIAWASIVSIDLAPVFWPSAAALLFSFRPLRISTRDGRTAYVQASVGAFDRVADYLRISSSHAHAIRWGFRFE